MSVHLIACLYRMSLFTRISQKPHVRASLKFCVHATCGHGRVVFGWNFDILCTSGYVDDIMLFTSWALRHGIVFAPVVSG